MRRIVLAAVLGAVLSTAACTSSGSPTHSPSATPSTPATSTAPTSASASVGPIVPVDTGPTRSAVAGSCPLVATQTVANAVGMRLARITVQHSGGKVVGCRIYALQHSYLAGPTQERLPGPNQPVIDIAIRTYASTTDAHNAFVLAARTGTNPQLETITAGNTGVCYQIEFYPKDKGRDWACAFSLGVRAVIIKSVVTSPASDVARVASEVAGDA